MRIFAAASLMLAPLLAAATAIMPLADVKAGMRGVGKTVFQGTRVDEFQVEVLGVLENLGPKQSIILARLSGGPLASTGVMQGMSGSPVYIDGKLVGAVALTFSFSKEPIAGIRPIAEMLALDRAPVPLRAAAWRQLSDPVELLTRPQPVSAGGAQLVEIATPLNFSGFTPSTLDYFAPKLRQFGLQAAQGTSSGSPPSSTPGDPKLIQPGSMISVQLLTGDMAVGADGTITTVEGSSVFGFGHRFMAAGPTELPFARSEVLTLVPNVQTSFKVSAPREWMGAITQDRSVGIAGTLGRQAAMIPFSIRVTGAGPQPGGVTDYRMRMINDTSLAPLLVQMAVYSAVEAVGRTLGAGTLRLRGSIAFEGAPVVRVDNAYASDFNVPLLASLGTSIPLAYILQSGFDGLKLKSVDFTIDSQDRKSQMLIDQVYATPRVVQPGGTVEVTVLFAGDNGSEKSVTVPFSVPVGATPGPLFVTVADATTANLTEYAQMLSTPPRSATQLVSFLNGLRPADKAYVRLWRQDLAYAAQGQDLPDPPSSVALVLSKTQSSLTGTALARGSKMAESAIATAGAVVSGSKTIQIEIKE